MGSRYTIQIVDEDGNVAFSWIPGSHVEQEFIDTIASRVANENVGIFRTRPQVAETIKATITGFLHELKSKVRP